MRKRIVEAPTARIIRPLDDDWLNLAEIATVEVSSEHDGFPVEGVFADTGGPGWRASRAGTQVIRILFDEPIAVCRIRLRFEETQFQRTQEFALRWSTAAAGTGGIVRQQWNFSPAGSTVEIEDYAVNLEAVSALELSIVPDIGSETAVATLAMWRVAGCRQS